MESKGKDDTSVVLVGTYTSAENKSSGIYIYNFDK